MNARTITIIVAALSTLADAAAVAQGFVSPTWGLVIAAVGTGLYGLVRALQKLAAGATLKSLLSTSEAWGALLVALAAIISAIAGVVPPHYAGGAALIAGVLLKVARGLQSKGIPAQADDVITENIRPPK
jgi:hypothetical protein